jgi:hypothetical protein
VVAGSFRRCGAVVSCGRAFGALARIGRCERIRVRRITGKAGVRFGSLAFGAGTRFVAWCAVSATSAAASTLAALTAAFTWLTRFTPFAAITTLACFLALTQAALVAMALRGGGVDAG